MCDYMTNVHEGMSDLLATPCKEAKEGNMTLKESIWYMGNKHLNGVETAEQECCYDLLELPMTQSSVKVEFISTCVQEDRVFIAKDDAILQKMNPNSKDVKIAGNTDIYANWPMQLEDWCLADYVSELEIRTKKCDTIEEETYELEQTQSDGDTITSRGRRS